MAGIWPTRAQILPSLGFSDSDGQAFSFLTRQLRHTCHTDFEWIWERCIGDWPNQQNKRSEAGLENMINRGTCIILSTPWTPPPHCTFQRQLSTEKLSHLICFRFKKTFISTQALKFFFHNAYWKRSTTLHSLQRTLQFSNATCMRVKTQGQKGFNTGEKVKVKT